MGWEVVRRFLARNDAREPRVYLNRGNELVITYAALRLMGEPTHVRLLVDRERRLLALEPSSADDAEAFRLSGSAASSRRFSTVALTRTFGLETRRQAFTPQWDGEELVFGPYAVAAPVAPEPAPSPRPAAPDPEPAVEPAGEVRVSVAQVRRMLADTGLPGVRR